jgi:tetratricopeptide (TPR) repeat protein
VDGEAVYFTREMLQAEILTEAGRFEEAKKVWEKALPRLAQSTINRPNDARLRLAHAFALAGVGEGEKAIAEALFASQLVSLKDDALIAPYYLHGLALVQARSERIADAKATLEALLNVPSAYSAPRFHRSPAWDSMKY